MTLKMILWLFMSLFALVSWVRPELSGLIAYGKLEGPSLRWNSSFVELAYSFVTIPVPKKWFSHFYVFASVLNSLMWWLKETKGSTTALLMGLVQLQVVRRSLESFLVEKHSNSKMLLGHYGIGFVHYTMLSMAVYFFSEPSVQSRFLHFYVVIFLYASLCQFQCHKYLASLRKDKAGYMLPIDGWFTLSSCPHYFFEIVIYACFWLVSGFQWSFGCCFVWVIVNLSILAFENHHWYLKTFPKELDVIARRNMLVPIKFNYI